MKVEYEYYSPAESFEKTKQRDIISYAGKLLETVGSCTLIVGVDDEDRPFVYACNGRFRSAIEFCVDQFLESSSCKF